MKRANSSNEKNPAKLKAVDMQGKPTIVSSTCLILPESVLFLQVGGFLHWKECMNLAELNKDYRQSYLPFRDAILCPLLESLEALCKSNVHEYCGKVYAPTSKRVCTCGSDNKKLDDYYRPDKQALGALDPRYEDSYDSLSIHDKCIRMVEYLSTLVRNMRPHLNFSPDSIANPNRMPDAIGDIGGWSLGLGVPGNAILHLYPRRAALAFNLSLANFAQGALECGDDPYFNDAFLGRGGINPSGSGFGQAVCYGVELMIPLSNVKFTAFIRKNMLPSKDTRALLGSVLTSRVMLCAPFLEWVNENGSAILIPNGLETFSRVDANEAMEEWDEFDDGRDWY